MVFQNGVPGPPGLECQKSVEKKYQMTRKRVKKTAKSVFGDFFDTFLTLPTGRPEKSFLRLFGDSGARGVETPVYGDCARKTRGREMHRTFLGIELFKAAFG